MRYSISVHEKATECYRMLEANKKQVSLKGYSLKIRIDPVRQILWNKEKIKQIRNLNILTRITDRKIPCVYTRLSSNNITAITSYC